MVTWSSHGVIWTNKGLPEGQQTNWSLADVLQQSICLLAMLSISMLFTVSIVHRNTFLSL